jgi:predicted DNA-binding ribbon-helix-helix protein
MKSLVVKHSVFIAGRRTSVSLENAFWRALKEIARQRKMPVSALIGEIKANKQNANLSSAIRLFVVGDYRAQIENFSHAEAERAGLSVVAHGIGIDGHSEPMWARAQK